MTFDEMIDKLLDNGIEITLKKENGVVWYGLNTGMKSELLIAKSPNPGGDETAIAAYLGMPVMAVHDTWRELLVKEDKLEVITTTTVR